MPWASIRVACIPRQITPRSSGCKLRRRFLSNGFTRSQDIASVLALNSLRDNKAPQEIEIVAHVRTVRKQKRTSFVELGDGSTMQSMQVVVEPELSAGLGTGTAVRIAGLWKPCPAGKEQSHELHAQEVEILGGADAEVYPLQKKYHSAEYLRTIPHMRLRTSSNAFIARLRSNSQFYISKYLREHGYIQVNPPIITSSDCEGAGEVFQISPKDRDTNEAPNKSEIANDEHNFFRDPKYLTVSSQLHLEAFIHEHQRVWALSPTFRAEKSDTPRHLSEFYMLEVELRTESLDQIMDTAEELIKAIVVELMGSTTRKELSMIKHIPEIEPNKTSSAETNDLRQRWEGLKKVYWPRITYDEAMKFLQEAVTSDKTTFRHKPEWQKGLQLEHERYLAATIGQGSPIFVTDYPQVVKPFYMLPSQERPQGDQRGATVSCFDLLLPDGCEVAGGSLREHRVQQLKQAMQEHGMVDEAQGPSAVGPLDWYLDLRRYGSVPHGGFGLGFDRLIGYLAGVDNVRDVVSWPRHYGRCDG